MYCLERLCQAMEVSLSGYYAWISKPESKRQQANEQILREIKDIHKQSRQSYGSPRVYRELKAKGVACSENKAARLMQINSIAAKRKRRFMVTTDSRHSHPVAENKLNQQFSANRPNENWVTDITYIWTKEG
jgi:transposase InsO family protein